MSGAALGDKKEGKQTYSTHRVTEPDLEAIYVAVLAGLAGRVIF